MNSFRLTMQLLSPSAGVGFTATRRAEGRALLMACGLSIGCGSGNDEVDVAAHDADEAGAPNADGGAAARDDTAQDDAAAAADPPAGEVNDGGAPEPSTPGDASTAPDAMTPTGGVDGGEHDIASFECTLAGAAAIQSVQPGCDDAASRFEGIAVSIEPLQLIGQGTSCCRAGSPIPAEQVRPGDWLDVVVSISGEREDVVVGVLVVGGHDLVQVGTFPTQPVNCLSRPVQPNTSSSNFRVRLDSELPPDRPLELIAWTATEAADGVQCLGPYQRLTLPLQ